VRLDAGRRCGWLTVEPHLTDLKQRAEVSSVSDDGRFEDVVQRRAVELVLASTGGVVSGTEQD
jgi:hypothetical protein